MRRILFLLLAIATNLATATQCRADVLLYDSAPNGTTLELTSQLPLAIASKTRWAQARKSLRSPSGCKKIGPPPASSR